MQRKSLMGLAAAAALVLASAPAGAQTVYCTNCASIGQQIQQAASEANTYSQLVSSYSTQLQQYQRQLTDAATLPQQVFAPAGDALKNVLNAYNGATSLAANMGNLSSAFASKYGDFNSYTQAGGMSPALMTQKYQQWTTDSNSNVLSTLQAVGTQQQQFADENAVVATLQGHTANAAGQMQALQAANEIGLQMVGQMQKLRELIMVQIQMQANTSQIAADRDAATAALVSQQNSRDLDPNLAKKW